MVNGSRPWHGERVGRLDEVDLSARLSREQGEKRLAAAQQRMVHLRLLLAGLIGPGRIGPPLLVDVRGVGRLRQGRRHQAPGRPPRPAARARRAVRRTVPPRAAPPLPVAVLADVARVGRDGRAGPLLVRPRPRRAGRGIRCRGGLGAGLPRDRRPGDDPGGRGHDHREVLPAPLARGAAEPLPVAGAGPLPRLEAHVRGLAQSRPPARLRGCGGGDAAPHRLARGPVARGRGGGQALGAGRGRAQR